MELKSLKKYFENKCAPDEAKQVLKWIDRMDASMDLDGEFENTWQKIKVKSGDFCKWSGNLEKVHERIVMEEIYESLNLDKKKNEVRYQNKDRPSKSGYELREHSRKRKFPYFVLGHIAAVILILIVVAYFQFPEKVKQSPSLVQIEKSTEPGQKLSFHLEDGTKIILNSGSKLRYPSSFGINKRTVLLEGEAFFEVKKDAARPFSVITESVITTSLGTSFNINAFPSNENIEIALVTGKVSVERTLQTARPNSLMLNPGEMATVLKSNYTFSKSPFDVSQKISWKDGMIYFKDADYPDIVSKLENWYGINIQTNITPFKEWKFNGKFEDETLENILIALQFGHEFEYEINGKNIKLSF